MSEYLFCVKCSNCNGGYPYGDYVCGSEKADELKDPVKGLVKCEEVRKIYGEDKHCPYYEEKRFVNIESNIGCLWILMPIIIVLFVIALCLGG